MNDSDGVDRTPRMSCSKNLKVGQKLERIIRSSFSDPTQIRVCYQICTCRDVCGRTIEIVSQFVGIVICVMVFGIVGLACPAGSTSILNSNFKFANKSGGGDLHAPKSTHPESTPSCQQVWHIVPAVHFICMIVHQVDRTMSPGADGSCSVAIAARVIDLDNELPVASRIPAEAVSEICS